MWVQSEALYVLFPGEKFGNKSVMFKIYKSRWFQSSYDNSGFVQVFKIKTKRIIILK